MSVFVTVLVEIDGSVASTIVVVSEVDICVMFTIGSKVNWVDSNPENEGIQLFRRNTHANTNPKVVLPGSGRRFVCLALCVFGLASAALTVSNERVQIPMNRMNDIMPPKVIY